MEGGFILEETAEDGGNIGLHGNINIPSTKLQV